MADEEELTQQEKPTIDRRLLQGNTVIYPFTKQQNIIGLQGTIKEKMTIVSEYEPEAGTYVERQIWLDTGDGSPAPTMSLRKGRSLRTMATTSAETPVSNNVSGLTFGKTSSGSLTFGKPSTGTLRFGKQR